MTGSDGWPTDDGGVMHEVPGLYFMGLLFQRGFYSMLIGGAGRDAQRIARHLARYVSERAGLTSSRSGEVSVVRGA